MPDLSPVFGSMIMPHQGVCGDLVAWSQTLPSRASCVPRCAPDFVLRASTSAQLVACSCCGSILHRALHHCLSPAYQL